MASPRSDCRPLPNRGELLALDLATFCGFYSTHSSGTWNFSETKERNDNKQHLALRLTLIDYINRHGIRKIVAEDVSVNRYFYDMRKLSEFRGVLLEVCDEMNLPEPEFVNPSTLKKFATGSGRATKADMVHACKSVYDFHPRTDDEADAFLLYQYFIRKYRIFE